MGKLITMVGNSGVGKTTLTHHLCQFAPFVSGLEQHVERPFQHAFSLDLQRYALANQIDYLLYRAEQEQHIRRSSEIGIQDGGLEQDFFVYTRCFFNKGFLSTDEYRLCERLYRLLRIFLPPPDLIVRLVAPLDVVAARHARRNRSLNISTQADLAELERLLEEWLSGVQSIPLLIVDAAADDYCSPHNLKQLVSEVSRRLDLEPGG